MTYICNGAKYNIYLLCLTNGGFNKWGVVNMRMRLLSHQNIYAFLELELEVVT